MQEVRKVYYEENYYYLTISIKNINSKHLEQTTQYFVIDSLIALALGNTPWNFWNRFNYSSVLSILSQELSF
jgi:hypothetical protein